MSAYVVSDKEVILIGAIVYARKYETIKIDNNLAFNVKDCAKTLLAENYRSVNNRYNETGSEQIDFSMFIKDEKFDYWLFSDYCNKILKEYTIVQKLKIVNHYDYQACECDDYKDSQAHKMVERAISALICQLDGYDDAPWGIE